MAGSLQPAFLTENDLELLLKDIPGGFKKKDDPFFQEGNKLLKTFVKQGVISYDDEEQLHRRDYVLCNVPGCNKEFFSVFEYESHYNALHRYLCHQCKKCLPTSHFLDLHILEQHDSYFSVQAERKPMYSCFVEECKQTSATPEERKDHCMRNHKFPSNFRFETSPTTTKVKKDRKDSKEGDDIPMEETTTKIETPPKMIKNFSFGHQKQKTFDCRGYARILTRKKKKDGTMEVEMTSALENSKTVEDLMESLPS